MTGTAEDGAEDRAYFQAIEETFVRLRGAPLLLSPADWQLAERWRQAGIPLDLVCRTLEEVFARRRERRVRGRIQSLRYCASAVEEAWEEVQALTAPGRRQEPSPVNVGARLSALAEALPETVPRRRSWAARIRSLSGGLEEVEGKLAELDGEIPEALEAALPGAEQEALDDQVERSLSALGGRLPAAEVRTARRRLRRQAVRRRLELPVLSLFSPAARRGDEPRDD